MPRPPSGAILRPGEREVKNRLKDTLVNHLGWVSLERFRDLAGNLEHWFSFYYPLLSPVVTPPGEPLEDKPLGLSLPRNPDPARGSGRAAPNLAGPP